MDKKQEMLRGIPKIDEVLQEQRLSLFFEEIPRPLIVEAVREVIDELRQSLLQWDGQGTPPVPGWDSHRESIGFAGGPAPNNLRAALLEAAAKRIEKRGRRSLGPLVNCTGVVLHTNLGRAPLSPTAAQKSAETAMGYSNLEYNLRDGNRGSRHSHVEKLLTRLTGTEAAMAVNNNAGAVLLCLSALAGGGGEVIVSRGELVEIGGSFRVPDIMELGGAVLREVGTTNKTKAGDYKSAITESTAALLKVHTSNYRIIGFTAEVGISELAALAQENQLPLIYDIGSGLLANLRQWGVDEPVVSEAVKAGADIVLFSGDKLLGGPQAGIAVGKKKYIDAMKKHPLARALRIDKMTLAALEETLRSYLSPEQALKEVPVLSMITASQDELRNRARRLAELIRQKTDFFDVQVVATEGQIGGGTTPGLLLKSYAVALQSAALSSDLLEKKLRSHSTPVIGRIFQDRVILDLRTVKDEEVEPVAAAVQQAAVQEAPALQPETKGKATSNPAATTRSK